MAGAGAAAPAADESELRPELRAERADVLFAADEADLLGKVAAGVAAAHSGPDEYEDEEEEDAALSLCLAGGELVLIPCPTSVLLR